MCRKGRTGWILLSACFLSGLVFLIQPMSFQGVAKLTPVSADPVRIQEYSESDMPQAFQPSGEIVYPWAIYLAWPNGPKITVDNPSQLDVFVSGAYVVRDADQKDDLVNQAKIGRVFSPFDHLIRPSTAFTEIDRCILSERPLATDPGSHMFTYVFLSSLRPSWLEGELTTSPADEVEIHWSWLSGVALR